MSPKNFTITDDGDISDGYHTFEELYEHRNLLWILFTTQASQARLGYLIADGKPSIFWVRDHYPEWDLILMRTDFGQMSYHVPNRYRPLYGHIIPEVAKDNYEYDGHLSEDVIKRMEALLT